MQRKGDFYYRNAIFLLLLPENEFLQKLWITNSHSNLELSIEKKVYVKFVEGFSGLFSSISRGTMVMWMQNVVSDDIPGIYSK